MEPPSWGEVVSLRFRCFSLMTDEAADGGLHGPEWFPKGHP